MTELDRERLARLEWDVDQRRDWPDSPSPWESQDAEVQEEYFENIDAILQDIERQGFQITRRHDDD